MFNSLLRSWYAGLLCLSVFFGYAIDLGLFNELWNKDFTKISFVIIALSLYQYFELGFILMREYVTNYKTKIKQTDLDRGFERADTMMTLGMIGTVLGFINMTSSFVTVDLSNVENIKQLLMLATNGMSTALYTTLVGLIGFLVIRYSYFKVENYLEKNNGKKAE